MKSLTRSFALFLCLALGSASFGCAAAVDDPAPTSEDAASSQEQALRAAPVDDVAPDAAAADCDAAPATDAGSYQELTSILESSSVALDDNGLAMSTCTRVCACCKKSKNRFCCSHCKWCSGPIGASGELAQ